MTPDEITKLHRLASWLRYGKTSGYVAAREPRQVEEEWGDLLEKLLAENEARSVSRPIRFSISFTGTRQSLATAQRAAVAGMIVFLGATEAHHGACLGADTFFAESMRLCVGCRLIAHPSTLAGMTSEHALACSDEVRPAKPPLDRNHDIVDECDLLIACPQSAEEELRSGTWATVRYARRARRTIYLVLPDGTVRKEGVGDDR